MTDRIGVLVGGQLVGTVPAFSDGVGEMLKSPFYSAHKGLIRAEIRQGEVVLLCAESLEIAGRMPEIEFSSGKPPRSILQGLLSFFGFGRSSLM